MYDVGPLFVVQYEATCIFLEKRQYHIDMLDKRHFLGFKAKLERGRVLLLVTCVPRPRWTEASIKGVRRRRDGDDCGAGSKFGDQDLGYKC